jgi:hypothetical protein
VLFDCSTTRAYRDFFASTVAVGLPGRDLVWRGGADPEAFAAGDHARAVLLAFCEQPDGTWTRTASRHLQRHHPRDVVERALDAAGLALAGAYGQTQDLRFESTVDEERHDKAIYVAVEPE